MTSGPLTLRVMRSGVPVRALSIGVDLVSIALLVVVARSSTLLGIDGSGKAVAIAVLCLVVTIALAVPRPNLILAGISALTSLVPILLLGVLLWVAAMGVLFGGFLSWVSGNIRPGAWGFVLAVPATFALQGLKWAIVLIAKIEDALKRRARRLTTG